MNAGLVESESATVYARKAVAWDSEDHLQLALPFQDLKPTISLGNKLWHHSSLHVECVHVF